MRIYSLAGSTLEQIGRIGGILAGRVVGPLAGQVARRGEVGDKGKVIGDKAAGIIQPKAVFYRRVVRFFKY